MPADTSPSSARRISRLKDVTAGIVAGGQPGSGFGHLYFVSGISMVLLIIAGVATTSALAGRQHLKCGIDALAQGHQSEAIYQLTVCLSANPNSAVAYRYRAMARSEEGDHKLALADFDKAILLQPTAALFTERAREHLCLREFSQALDDTNHSLRLQPNSAEAVRVRAFAEAGQQNFSKAVVDINAYLQSATSMTPASKSQALMLLSTALQAVGKPQEAFQAIQQALTIDPNSELHCQKALLLSEQHKWQQAISSYTASITLKASAKALSGRAACLSALRKIPEAINDLDRAIAFSPSDLKLRKQRGALLIAWHKPEQALVDLQMAAGTGDKETKQLQEQAAGIIVAEKKASASVRRPTIASQPTETQGKPTTAKGYQLMRAGDNEKAVSVLSAVLKQQPSDTQARRYLAYALAGNGRAKEAAEQFRIMTKAHVLALEDTLPFAKACQSSGDIAEAVLYYEQYLSRNAGDAETRIALIKAYQQIGQPKRALQLVREGLSITRDPIIKHKLAQLVQGSGP